MTGASVGTDEGSGAGASVKFSSMDSCNEAVGSGVVSAVVPSAVETEGIDAGTVGATEYGDNGPTESEVLVHAENVIVSARKKINLINFFIVNPVPKLYFMNII